MFTFALYLFLLLAHALALCVALRFLWRKARRLDAIRVRWLRRQINKLRPNADVEWLFRLWPFYLLRLCFWRWDIQTMVFPSTAKTQLQADVIRLGVALSNLQFDHDGLGRILDDVAAQVNSNTARVEKVLAHDEQVIQTLLSVLQVNQKRTGVAVFLPYRFKPDSISNN